MDHNHYQHLLQEGLILRDHLALERTAMANERTLLSYVRTMIGLIAVGGSMIKFFDGVLFIISGWSFIGFGGIALAVGFIRYIRIESILYGILQEDVCHQHDDWMHRLFWITLQKLHLAKIKTS